MKGIQGLEVQRTTKYSDYKFDEIEPRLFRLKGSVIKEANMLAKSDEYWAKVRQVPLTKKESSMQRRLSRTSWRRVARSTPASSTSALSTP